MLDECRCSTVCFLIFPSCKYCVLSFICRLCHSRGFVGQWIYAHIRRLYFFFFLFFPQCMGIKVFFFYINSSALWLSELLSPALEKNQSIQTDMQTDHNAISNV